MSQPRRVGVLVSGLGWHVQDLVRAAASLPCELIPVPFPSVRATIRRGASTFLGGSSADGSAPVELREMDAVLVRMMPPGTLEQVVFRMDLLHRLEADGRRIVNPPRAVEMAVDKFLSLSRLEQAGLPVPATWTGESAADALIVFDELGRDVVLKPLFGSEGRGLIRLTDREVAWRVFHALERIGSVLYLQEFIPNDGTDLRVFVLGGRVLGTIRRRAVAGDWRANIALGGTAESIPRERRIEELAITASRALGTLVAGVDLVENARTGHWMIVEVNAVPGWRGFAAATGIDVASEILHFALAEEG